MTSDPRPHARSLSLARLVLVSLVAAGCAGSRRLPTQQPFDAAAGCAGPAFHALDFWLGDWDVESGGAFDGDDRISSALGGCALREQWTSADGAQGESLFFFDRSLSRWKQLWVTSEGAWKEKVQVEAPHGSVRFEGEVPRPAGGVALDRTTLALQPDGTVLQRIERSIDGGQQWQAWAGRYRRKKPACESPEHHQFDFWLGDWDLTVRAPRSGAPSEAPWQEARGSNHVRRADGGCTVVEEFHAAGPDGPWTGGSVSQWQPAQKQWRQTWVDESNGYLAFEGGMEGSELVLRGEARPAPGGGTQQMRMVFAQITGRSFTWRWERTVDGGKSWQPQLVIEYRRRTA